MPKNLNKNRRNRSLSPKRILNEKVYGNNTTFYWILSIAILIIVGIIRTRLLTIPLERDEGEFAYIGKSILEGIPPYKEAYGLKLPGTYFIYSIIMLIFGKSTIGIHLGLLIFNGATSILIFLIGKKVFNSYTGLLSSITYAIISISQNVLGFAAHATHFVIFFAVMGIYLLILAIENKNKYSFLISGIMFGMSFLMKQPGIFYILFGIAFLLYHQFRQKIIKKKIIVLNIAIFFSGFIIPYVGTVIYMFSMGVFQNFWFWTYEYARKYAVLLNLPETILMLKLSLKPIFKEFIFFIIIAVLNIIFLVIRKINKYNTIFLILLTFFSTLAVSAGFYFRSHYYILLLPAFCLLVGNGLNNLRESLKTKSENRYLLFLPSLIFLFIVINIAVTNFDYYFKTDPATISRNIYGDNPFPESIKIAEFLKTNSSEHDHILIFGSEPQILFYSNRSSSTGYIYTYGLMENQEYNISMQKQMISEIEKQTPIYIVLCKIPSSWSRKANSPTLIFDWFDKYIRGNYKLVGVVDIVSENQTIYKWFEEVNFYAPQSNSLIFIFRNI
jgi:hypothetical protein